MKQSFSGYLDDVPLGWHIYDEKFKPLIDIFRQNFVEGLESEGCSFAVYQDGEPRAVLWGGWSHSERSKEWTEDTLSVLFSTTKCLSAIVLAWVLQENGVSYTEKVTKFWPEYGNHGKEHTTILQVSLHQAGLPYGATSLTAADVESPTKMAAYFEDAQPIWTPGTQSGYHALTIGFLMDQLVRRIDSKARGIAEILEEDLLKPNSSHLIFSFLDISIGLRTADDHERVARLVGPSLQQINQEEKLNPESLRRYNLGCNAYNDQLYATFPFLLPTAEDYNVLENRLLRMPSNMGIGSTAAIAKLLSLIAAGQILNEKTLSTLAEPVLEETFDVINGYPESKGYGFQYTRSTKNDWEFGHSGLGGQNVRVNTSKNIAFAYFCNGMKVADADLVLAWRKLVNKVYEVI